MERVKSSLIWRVRCYSYSLCKTLFGSSASSLIVSSGLGAIIKFEQFIAEVNDWFVYIPSVVDIYVFSAHISCSSMAFIFIVNIMTLPWSLPSVKAEMVPPLIYTNF